MPAQSGQSGQPPTLEKIRVGNSVAIFSLFGRKKINSLRHHQSPAVRLHVGIPGVLSQSPVVCDILRPVADVIASHGIQHYQYADDTQLRLAMHADNTSHRLAVLAQSTADVRQWYLQNGLQLNPDKSEALIIGTANQLHLISVYCRSRSTSS